MVDWACARKRSNPDHGGMRLPITVDGMCGSTPPRTFSACKAATLGDARDGALSDPKKIIMKSPANWGRASAQQIKRILADSELDNSRLPQHVDEVLGHCDARRAFGRAPHVLTAGTSAISIFNEKLQLDLLFLGRNRSVFLPWTVLKVLAFDSGALRES